MIARGMKHDDDDDKETAYEDVMAANNVAQAIGGNGEDVKGQRAQQRKIYK